MTERFPTDVELQNAWDEYLDAYHLAHQTQDIHDGIIAAKLWKRWLRFFDRQKRFDCAPGDNVIYVGFFGGIKRGKK